MPHQEKAKFSPPNFTLYPLTWLAISFAAGISLENRLGFSWTVYLSVCLISAIYSFIFLKQKFVFIPLLLAFISLGALCFQVEKLSVAPNRLKVLYDSKIFISSEPIEITGVLQGKPELSAGGFFLTL